MSGLVVYLMRGLPSCGKSRRARELAEPSGAVCETDQFFHTQVGQHPDRYDYDSNRVAEARDWNFGRFVGLVDIGISPIVVDRGNGLNMETKRYAKCAVDHGYSVILSEPNSPWWLEIRELLRSKTRDQYALRKWAGMLANLNKATHRTPAETIYRWMEKWNPNLTVDDILNYHEPSV